MAGVATPVETLPEQLLARFQALPRPRGYLVALSGGGDSVALLALMTRLRNALGLPLRAVHVDHGLHSGAEAARRFCQRLCADLAVPLEHVSLDLQPPPGASLEAAAREARYQALARVLEPEEMLLVAHHADDQAETVLLQLLRGAGVEGLAAMPEVRPWAGGWMARPLLGHTRSELRAWAKAQGLGWVQDPMNEDLRFDRNFLRHQVIPLLETRWPALAKTLSRSARHCAEAARLLGVEEEALLRQAMAGRRLALAPLPLEDAGRMGRLLRAWLRQIEAPMPPSARLDDFLEQLRSGPTARLVWPGGQIRRYRGWLYLLPEILPEVPADFCSAWDGVRPLDLPAGLGRLLAPAGPPRWFPKEGVAVSFRRPGLACRPVGRQGHRDFKKLCQDLGLPPWVRGRVPLILASGRLAAVADLMLCEPAEPPLGLVWERPEWMS